MLVGYAISAFAGGRAATAGHAIGKAFERWEAPPEMARDDKLAFLVMLGELARLQAKSGDLGGAEVAYRFILQNEVELFGQNAPESAQTRQNLETVLRWRKAAAERLGYVMAVIDHVLSAGASAEAPRPPASFAPLTEAQALDHINKVLSLRDPPLSPLTLTPMQLMLMVRALKGEALPEGAKPAGAEKPKRKGWWPFG